MKEFGGKSSSCEWFDELTQVQSLVDEVYPQVQWEEDSIYIDGENRKVITGDISGLGGSLSLTISEYPFQMVRIDGSHNVDQMSEVLTICEHLNLSCLDPQTGELVCAQGQ